VSARGRAPRRRRGSLAMATYAFAAGIALAVMAALLILPRYVRTPRYLEPQAALVQNVVDRLSLREPGRRGEVMARLAARLRGQLTLFSPPAAPGSAPVAQSSTAAALSAPTRAELAELARAKWALSFGRIAVRSDDGSLLAVYQPNRPGFPWHFVVPLGLGVLTLVGAASVWFSRRLVRPLGELAAAARRFGSGDTSARARLSRDDELGEVGRAFDDMAGRTEAMLQAQRQLMADVSHELRTPLARIRVALELVVEDPVAARDVLVDVGSDLDEIDQLIEDILVTARLDSELPPLRRQPLAVAELARRAVAGFTARHPGRQLHHPAAPPEHAAALVDCDAVLLRRALDNLLDNAAKYSDDTSPVMLTLVAGASAPDGGDAAPRVVFEVRDLGVGMSAEDLRRAFTPFWRADASRTRHTGGVGLGLPLARRIARAHGGELTLSSTPGRGTTARLELPLAPR
jgi:two-component system, OmpR family, sensor kinase